jgi:hypothetical protein
VPPVRTIFWFRVSHQNVTLLLLHQQQLLKLFFVVILETRLFVLE